MNISELSIKKHVFAWMLMAALIIFGGISFSRLGVSQLPDVDFPVVSVSISLHGATPEIMELTVVDPIEDALTSVQGIKSISSSSRAGNANITVEFGLDKDIDVAVQEIQSAISRIQRNLPYGIEAPSIRKSNPENTPILWLSVTADNMTQPELMKLVRYQIQDSFSSVSGVGEVMIGGFADPNLRVWLNKEKLNQYQLTATDIINTIQREHLEQPGGRIETSSKELNIRTLGEAFTVKEFENISINRRGGSLNYRPIPLKNVVSIEEGTEDIRSLSRANGKVTIGLGIRKQPKTNAVQVAHDVKEKMKEISARLPKGVEMAVRFDLTQFIEDSIRELYFTLILSAILTSIVCWIFLGSWTATLNIILAIPTSIIGSFIILYALGFTLNSFTLLGLSLAIGIVVDDAIMVLENIVRHREKGKGRLLAALEGSKEITFAAIAATAAIIAIFLPVAFMEGIIGRYFLQFGVTLSIAVALSLLEALTLTPMRTSQFLKVEKRSTWFGKMVEKGFLKSSYLYKKLIPKTIDRPYVTIIVALAFFLSTLYIGKIIKKEFVPSQDQSRLMISIRTTVGSSLAFTNEKVKQVENYLSSRPEVDGYFSNIGGGSQINTGSIMLNLKPPNKRKLSAQKFAGAIRKDLNKIPDLKVIIQDPSLTGLTARRGFPIEFSIRGSDWDKLVEVSNKMTDEMEKSGLMSDVDTNYQTGMPEIEVIPDRVKARERGVEISEISQTINIMMASAVVGKYSEGGRRFDIRVGLPLNDRKSKETIKTLNVRNNRGELIPLSNLVTLKQINSLQSISREDRQRAINVFANVTAKSSQAEAIKAVYKIADKVMPSGYYIVASGSSKTFNESFQSLIFALILGILVSYMVLASQFNSFVHPLTILIALPFSVSGAFIGLYFTGQTLNIYSMIGLILLMGIVKKNSILLVEFTNQMRAKGMSVRESLVEACPIRLRPILMTSIATIAAAIPPALAIGPGAESRQPMAVAVISGVILSTLLTLFVVPSVYTVLGKIKRKTQNNKEI